MIIKKVSIETNASEIENFTKNSVNKLYPQYLERSKRLIAVGSSGVLFYVLFALMIIYEPFDITSDTLGIVMLYLSFIAFIPLIAFALGINNIIAIHKYKKTKQLKCLGNYGTIEMFNVLTNNNTGVKKIDYDEDFRTPEISIEDNNGKIYTFKGNKEDIHITKDNLVEKQTENMFVRDLDYIPDFIAIESELIDKPELVIKAEGVRLYTPKLETTEPVIVINSLA